MASANQTAVAAAAAAAAGVVAAELQVLRDFVRVHLRSTIAAYDEAEAKYTDYMTTSSRRRPQGQGQGQQQQQGQLLLPPPIEVQPILTQEQRDVVRRVREQTCALMILGANSSGKSTLVNALLSWQRAPAAGTGVQRVRVVPVSSGHVSKRTVRFCWAPMSESRISFARPVARGAGLEQLPNRDKTAHIPIGNLKEASERHLMHLVAGGGVDDPRPGDDDYKDWVETIVQVYYPFDFLQPGIDLYDTPGTSTSDDNEVQAALRLFWACVRPVPVFVYANPSFSDAEIECFKQFQSAMPQDTYDPLPIMFVSTHFDAEILRNDYYDDIPDTGAEDDTADDLPAAVIEREIEKRLGLLLENERIRDFVNLGPTPTQATAAAAATAGTAAATAAATTPTANAATAATSTTLRSGGQQQQHPAHAYSPRTSTVVSARANPTFACVNAIDIGLRADPGIRALFGELVLKLHAYAASSRRQRIRGALQILLYGTKSFVDHLNETSRQLQTSADLAVRRNEALGVVNARLGELNSQIDVRLAEFARKVRERCCDAALRTEAERAAETVVLTAFDGHPVTAQAQGAFREHFHQWVQQHVFEPLVRELMRHVRDFEVREVQSLLGDTDNADVVEALILKLNLTGTVQDIRNSHHFRAGRQIVALAKTVSRRVVELFRAAAGAQRVDGAFKRDLARQILQDLQTSEALVTEQFSASVRAEARRFLEEVQAQISDSFRRKEQMTNMHPDDRKLLPRLRPCFCEAEAHVVAAFFRLENPLEPTLDQASKRYQTYCNQYDAVWYSRPVRVKTLPVDCDDPVRRRQLFDDVHFGWTLCLSTAFDAPVVALLRRVSRLRRGSSASVLPISSATKSGGGPIGRRVSSEGTGAAGTGEDDAQRRGSGPTSLPSTSHAFPLFLGLYQTEHDWIVVTERFDTTLDVFLQRNISMLPMDTALHMARHLASGISILHANGHTHGELRSADIFIRKLPLHAHRSGSRAAMSPPVTFSTTLDLDLALTTTSARSPSSSPSQSFPSPASAAAAAEAAAAQPVYLEPVIGTFGASYAYDDIRTAESYVTDKDVVALGRIIYELTPKIAYSVLPLVPSPTDMDAVNVLPGDVRDIVRRCIGSSGTEHIPASDVVELLDNLLRRSRVTHSPRPTSKFMDEAVGNLPQQVSVMSVVQQQPTSNTLPAPAAPAAAVKRLPSARAHAAPAAAPVPPVVRPPAAAVHNAPVAPPVPAPTNTSNVSPYAAQTLSAAAAKDGSNDGNATVPMPRAAAPEPLVATAKAAPAAIAATTATTSTTTTTNNDDDAPKPLPRRHHPVLANKSSLDEDRPPVPPRPHFNSAGAPPAATAMAPAAAAAAAAAGGGSAGGVAAAPAAPVRRSHNSVVSRTSVNNNSTNNNNGSA